MLESQTTTMPLTQNLCLERSIYLTKTETKHRHKNAEFTCLKKKNSFFDVGSMSYVFKQGILVPVTEIPEGLNKES